MEKSFALLLRFLILFGPLPVTLSAESIRGMLTENGAPASNVKVAALDSKKQQLPPTYTNKDGLFFLRGIERNQAYALRVWIDPERAVDFPIVVSVKPSSDLPPVEIGAATECQREREISREEVGEFLRRYYRLYQDGDVEQLALMYGDFVDYYENGSKDRSFIAKDKRNFVTYLRKRQFELKDFDVYGTMAPCEKGVRFTFSFLLGPLKPPMVKPKKSTEVWTLRRIKGRIQIVLCRSDRMGS